MGTEAIILAGGLGTRLRSVVADIPKCMAPVAGKPFLHYVLEQLKSEGVDQFIFSLGHLSEQVIHYLETQQAELRKQYSVESSPLGTGGAIKLACSKAREKTVIVVNGDTLFSLDLKKLTSFHQQCAADCTLSLKPMTDFNRYGVVELHKDHSVASFKEKQHYESGLINAGVYALDPERFLSEDLPERFSFETDYLETHYKTRKIFGVVQNSYFIDIGIPKDYERAQIELPAQIS
ncbi:MAG: nucleotidyltransferase family protein [Chitinophagaceae bacterium]|nr:nucleotidyltransferase family protein [Chitinophagaceae bacterium]